MNVSLTPAAVGLYLIVAVHPLPAQRLPTPLDSGRLVRIHTVDGVTEARLLRTMTATSTEVEFCVWTWTPCPRAPGDHRTLPRADVQQIDAYHTWSSRGALIGFAVGVASGYSVGASWKGDNGQSYGGVLAVVGGLLLAIPGAIIGSFVSRWVQVSF